VSNLIGAKPDYACGWVFPSIALEIASPTNEFMLTPVKRQLFLSPTTIIFEVPP
jgi:hypothetical protein